MLVARINRPGAAARPGQRAVAPKIDQTTLVRVILPLKKQVT